MTTIEQFEAFWTTDPECTGRRMPKLTRCVFTPDVLIGGQICRSTDRRTYYYAEVADQDDTVTAAARTHCGIQPPYNNIVSSLATADGVLWGIKYTPWGE